MDNSRRGFLVNAGKLLLILPVGFSLAEQAAGCGGEDECGGANTVDENDAEYIYTSSCAGSGHVHQFTITKAELASPPVTETRDTTPYKDDGHVHSVTLNLAEFSQIQNGGTVTKTTSEVNAHSHVFTFKKATA